MRQMEQDWGGIQQAANQASAQIGQIGNSASDSQTDITQLEQSVQDMSQELLDAGDAGDNLGDEMDQAGNEGKKAADKISGAFKAVAGVLAAVFAVDKIKDFATSAVEAAAEQAATSAQYSEVFGEMEGEATIRLQAIGDEASILENRMKGSFTKMAAFAKVGGMDTAESLDLADRSMRAIADSAAFYDKSLETTTESLQSFLKGNFENDAALGLSATETTRNAAAMDEYGKKFIELDEAQKQLTLLKMVEDANKVSGALGQAARESEGWENVVGNMKQAWTDFQAVIGVPFLEVATNVLLKLTDAFQNVDAQKLADGFSAAIDYLSETFMPLINLVMEDLKELWAVLGDSSAGGGLETTLQIIQDSMHWLADNWEGIKDGIFALTGAFVAYHAALKAILIFQTINKLMVLYQSGLLITTASQWLLNTAMFANPFGMVALAIGALVGVGILLYRNWDTVREKTAELWDKLGAAKGVVTFILGPIGLLIKAAVDIAKNWDSTKSVWENVWGGIVSATESSVNLVVDSINWLIEKINLIPGVNIPIVPKVDWTGPESFKSSDMVKEMSYAEAVAGSHATGLERVPRNGYLAELHKDEAVLTASQSDTLRGLGVLRSTGARPVIDTGPLQSQKKVYRPTREKQSPTISIGNIQVTGHNKPTKEIVDEIVEELTSRIAGGALA